MNISRKKKILYIFLFYLFSALGILWQYSTNMQKATEKQLIQYQPEISNELNNYDLTEFTPILIAIMDQESLGKGNDPMQSSESAGLKRNEIENLHISIKQGVYHFSQMYKYVQNGKSI